MHGLNKEFKKNPLAFIQKYRITQNLGTNQNPTAPVFPGIATFDFQHRHISSMPQITNVVNFCDFGHRGTPATFRTQRITAYWLPWERGGTTVIQLGDDADYFFTTQLTGCRLVIAPVNDYTIHPYVLHIAGDQDLDGDSNNDPHGTLWRTQQEENALENIQRNSIRVQRFSMTGQDNQGYHGISAVNVIGFKDTNALEWQFWAQDDDIQSVSEPWRIIGD